MWIRMNGLPLCGVGCERISPGARRPGSMRSEEHTSELQSRSDLVCRLLLEKKKKKRKLPLDRRVEIQPDETTQNEHPGISVTRLSSCCSRTQGWHDLASESRRARGVRPRQPTRC